MYLSEKSKMEIKPLQNRSTIEGNKKLQAGYQKLAKLLEVLHKRELPEAIIQKINERIDRVNQETDDPKTLRQTIKKQQYGITKLLEKELKIVPKNHYRKLWTGLGMSVFGLPLGIVFGTAIGNIAFLGIGLPIGMVIGMAIGAEKDEKAAAEGRQLNLDYEL
jgi:hypothetical protein